MKEHWNQSSGRFCLLWLEFERMYFLRRQVHPPSLPAAIKKSKVFAAFFRPSYVEVTGVDSNWPQCARCKGIRPLKFKGIEFCPPTEEKVAKDAIEDVSRITRSLCSKGADREVCKLI